MDLCIFIALILIRRKLTTFLSREKTVEDLDEDTCAEELIVMETQPILLRLSRWLLTIMMITTEFAPMCKLEDQYLLCGVKFLIYNGNLKFKSLQTLL